MLKPVQELIKELGADLASPTVIPAIDNAIELLQNLRKLAVSVHGEGPQPSPSAQHLLPVALRHSPVQEQRLPIAQHHVSPVDGQRLPILVEGTLADLITRYRFDERSPYQKLRHATRMNYESLLRRLLSEHGDEVLASWKMRRIEELHARWTAKGKLSMAHSLMTMLRGLISFGATVLEDPECERLSVLFHQTRFEVVIPQTLPLTKEHATAFIKAAHDRSQPSMALAQAFQFDCALRQKDTIGEWVPLTEEGDSDIEAGSLKWLRGIRWEEIDDHLVLRHVASMSGKLVENRLSEAPLVLAELERIGERRRWGPVVVSESTEMPYAAHEFRRRWRSIARECGIPDGVKNMDTRAGAKDEEDNMAEEISDAGEAAGLFVPTEGVRVPARWRRVIRSTRKN